MEMIANDPGETDLRESMKGVPMDIASTNRIRWNWSKLFFRLVLLVVVVPPLIVVPSFGASRTTSSNWTRSDLLRRRSCGFAYLDESDPFYVSTFFPKLTTPQWVGEEGVDAVVILSIDDLGDATRYEKFLRPILDRLKRIDGRAALSITTNRIDPELPHLQNWLSEGVSLETHTTAHACPMLRGGDLSTAKEDYDRCVDLLFSVPGNHPVAFRVPCCDSMDATSPRFFSEIFNKTTPKGNFLTISSSVFNLFTSDDPELPAELVTDPNGLEKFAKYIPGDRDFANYVENYPYPFVIGRLCWEFPALMPSDWDAQHYQQPNNPFTVEDLQAGIDATVVKKGVFTLVFHPHGWIRNDQVVELIDHTVYRYGNRVKFLSFREAQQCLNTHLLAGHPLRDQNGEDNGVRILDLNGDGFLDVVIGNEEARLTRVWSPDEKKWKEAPFPVSIVARDAEDHRIETGVKFGSSGPHGPVFAMVSNEGMANAWLFDGEQWLENKSLLDGLEIDGERILTNRNGIAQGVCIRDLDHDGCDELILGNESVTRAFGWNHGKEAWESLPFGLPPETAIVNSNGRDAGLRFVDLDDDGYEDIIFSNEDRYSLFLFDSMKTGWSRKVLEGKRTDQSPIPMISRAGTNNGAWFRSRTMWVNNEDTDGLPNRVKKVEFNELLKTAGSAPKSTESGLLSWRVRPGFEVELVAAEPLVMDPVAIDWGPDGKLWVAEMADYPEGVHGNYEPGGRIRFLEDLDGDGRYDRSTVFLEKVPFPSGVLAYRKGVLVSAAPDVFYAEDTDGNGKADHKEVLYTGFGSWNQQHLVNGLRWGLDNWIHLANGDSGGRIRSLKTGKVLDIRGRDLRIEPEKGLLDTEYGQTQYGRNRDDWGNWFGCANPNPMWHFVLNDRYIRRNPQIAAPNPKADVSVTPGAAPVFPVSRTLPRFNDPWAANRFTSACSTIVYRDSLFGPVYEGNSFVCEPVHNLVHREIMAPEGVTFTSHRATDESQGEFLASTDNWCRPVMVRTGPDGALWVVDMYREQIEHPQFIPEELQKGVDFRAGDDRGRIYRVYPIRARLRKMRDLTQLPIPELVAQLDTDNGTWRDLVHRSLLERRDPEAASLLAGLVLKSTRPVCRMQALCALDGLGSLEVNLLEKALHDPHPGVRRHAIRLSEPFLNEHPSLGRLCLDLLKDPDPQVRLQLAYSLGEWDSPEAGRALGSLAVNNSSDRFIRAAVMSSIHRKNLADVVSAVLDLSAEGTPSGVLFADLVNLAVAYEDYPAAANLIGPMTRPKGNVYEGWQVTGLCGFLDALDRRRISLSDFRNKAPEKFREKFDGIQSLFEYARTVVEDEESPEEDCLTVIPLLGRAKENPSEDIAVLQALLVPQSSLKLKEAAVESLGRINHPDIPKALLSVWKNLGLDLRTRILEILLNKEEWTRNLLESVEEGAVLPREIDAVHRERLFNHRRKDIRDKATKIFGSSIDPDRAKVIEDYQSALRLPGNGERGKEVFKKRCSTCHRLRDEGRPVGPNLAALSDKSPKSLLINILDPNRSVENKFLNYVAETYQGDTFSGLLSQESGNSITLIGADGKDTVILREDLESLRSTEKSFMPEGLEADLSPQDLSDLFVWIGASGPKRRVVPGNEPETVHPEPFRGAIWLLSTNAEIYGTGLTLEKKYENLSNWTDNNDFVAWTFVVTEAQTFNILLDYSCADEMAGNSYQIEVAGKRFSGNTEGTGSWENYQIRQIGEIHLEPGEYRLILRPLGELKGRLMDFKGLGLRPR